MHKAHTCRESYDLKVLSGCMCAMDPFGSVYFSKPQQAYTSPLWTASQISPLWGKGFSCRGIWKNPDVFVQMNRGRSNPKVTQLTIQCFCLEKTDYLGIYCRAPQPLLSLQILQKKKKNWKWDLDPVQVLFKVCTQSFLVFPSPQKTFPTLWKFIPGILRHVGSIQTGRLA